ncbi:MAG: hypothetical protein HZA53_10920 [Planctomycetes bacterium]|nr:hypothetical protein [Planctomycetota bacterium]
MRGITGRIVLFAALAATAWAASEAPKRSPRDATATWKGKRVQLDKLPADVPAAAKLALETWLAWADEHGYRCDFDAQGRILLVSPDRGSGPDAKLKSIAKTETWFDQLLPAPPKPAEPAEARPAPKDAPIPEDPETPPPGAPKTDERPTSTTWSTTWGAGHGATDSITAVLFVLRDEADQSALIDALAARHAYLSGWSAVAKQQVGFVLEEPLCGAFVEKVRGQEEWDPEHELVHRAAQALCLRRFGQLPYWLQTAVGWEAEVALDGTLYCFPYRDEFVFAAEHGGWPNDLKSEFKDRDDRPLNIGEVALWTRGKFDGKCARKAWGLLHHAAGATKGKLSPLFAELARFRSEHDRRETGPNAWERIPGYEIPPHEQERMLKAHLGDDLFEAATRAFKKGLEGVKSTAKAGATR